MVQQVALVMYFWLLTHTQYWQAPAVQVSPVGQKSKPHDAGRLAGVNSALKYMRLPLARAAEAEVHSCPPM